METIGPQMEAVIERKLLPQYTRFMDARPRSGLTETQIILAMDALLFAFGIPPHERLTALLEVQLRYAEQHPLPPDHEGVA